MRGDKGHKPRQNLGSEPTAIKYSEVPNARTLIVLLAAGRNGAAKIECSAALSGSRDVILLALDSHKRRLTDRAEPNWSVA
jgi:hypothetical protein